MTDIIEPDGEDRYRIICSKDAAWDGRFVFAVRTTGVFCRPSCPARTPLQRNVEYFDGPAAAVRAGYRACLRCRPREGHLAELAAKDAWVLDVCRRLQEGEGDVSLKRVAAEVGRSLSAVQRAFKAAVGVSPKEYAAAIRRRDLRRALREPETVTQAAYTAGYGSSGRLYADVGRALGMAPSRFKARGEGEQIRFATAPCSLGLVLVARTERGVCSVALGDEQTTLEADLARDFSNAEVRMDDAGLQWELQQVVLTLETGAPATDLPLDIRGTAFQHRVWSALCDIHPGETATYREIALRVGAPGAVRAVGAACGANRLAVVVPCHRVLRSDGSLGGYRWGLEKKRRLLAGEGALPGGVRGDGEEGGQAG